MEEKSGRRGETRRIDLDVPPSPLPPVFHFTFTGPGVEEGTVRVTNTNPKTFLQMGCHWLISAYGWQDGEVGSQSQAHIQYGRDFSRPRSATQLYHACREKSKHRNWITLGSFFFFLFLFLFFLLLLSLLLYVGNSVGQGLFVILIFPRSRVRVMDAFNHLSTGNAISNRCSKRKKRSRPRNMRFIVSPAFLTLLNFFSSLSLSKEWRALERNSCWQFNVPFALIGERGSSLVIKLHNPLLLTFQDFVGWRSRSRIHVWYKL